MESKRTSSLGLWTVGVFGFVLVGGCECFSCAWGVVSDAHTIHSQSCLNCLDSYSCNKKQRHCTYIHTLLSEEFDVSGPAMVS